MSSNPNTPALLGKYGKSVDHIAIAVRDLEEGIKLYSEQFGFQLHERRRTEGRTSAMVSAVMKAGPITIVLLQGTTPESQVSRYVDHYGPGVQHIAIEVDDLPALTEELKSAGVQFDTSIISSPGLRQIFTHRDENSGMMYELIQRLGGDFSDESVQNLFEQLEAKDTY
ncbi:MAG TPA: VOC family protein [Thermoanaerobaculia bacterium]|nr:VOC family protein [Thermoanaerobaculia bacterium]